MNDILARTPERTVNSPPRADASPRQADERHLPVLRSEGFRRHRGIRRRQFSSNSSVAKGLASLRGLREGGERVLDLRSELRLLRDRFYGFYLVGCEDIGMAPDLADDGPIDPTRCLDAATDWLSKWADDPDLTIDTRVTIPIMVDVRCKVIRAWATLGVRLAKLDAAFLEPPPFSGVDAMKPGKHCAAARGTLVDRQDTSPNRLAAHFPAELLTFHWPRPT